MTECLNRNNVLNNIRREYARLRIEAEQLLGNMREILELLEKIKRLFDDRKFEEVLKLISDLGFNPLDPNDPIIQRIDQQRRLLVDLSKDIFMCPCCHGTGRHPPQMHKGKI